MSNSLREAQLLPLFVVFALLILGNPSQAQDQAPAIRVNVNLVLVDATVKTKAGQIMADLKQNDLQSR